MNTEDFRKAYIHRIRYVFEFRNFKKESYIRFRYKSGWNNNSILSNIFYIAINERIDWFSLVYEKTLDPVYIQKVSQLLEKYHCKIIINNGRFNGLSFSEKKYKNLFILAYGDIFPPNYTIK